MATHVVTPAASKPVYGAWEASAAAPGETIFSVYVQPPMPDGSEVVVQVKRNGAADSTAVDYGPPITEAGLHVFKLPNGFSMRSGVRRDLVASGGGNIITYVEQA